MHTLMVNLHKTGLIWRHIWFYTSPFMQKAFQRPRIYHNFLNRKKKNVFVWSAFLWDIQDHNIRNERLKQQNEKCTFNEAGRRSTNANVIILLCVHVCKSTHTSLIMLHHGILLCKFQNSQQFRKIYRCNFNIKGSELNLISNH